MNVDVDLQNMNVRREHLAHFVHYKVDIHWMLRHAKELGRPLRILNVGCGECNEMRMLYTAHQVQKSTVVKSYIGLDGDGRMLERTQEKAATVLRGIHGSLHTMDITSEDFPVKPGSQDLIISNEVLEHIPGGKVPRVLRQIRRAARSDAVILISTPNKDGTNDRLPADHVKEWGYQELQDAFAAAGLEVVDHQGVYIKKANLVRYLRENNPDLVEYVENLWDRFGLDIGSMLTADLARPVANNLIWRLRKA